MKTCYGYEMQKKRRLWDEYLFPGFHPKAEIQGMFGDHKARILSFKRRQKKRHVAVAASGIGVFTTERCDWYETLVAARPGFIWRWKFGGCFAKGAAW